MLNILNLVIYSDNDEQHYNDMFKVLNDFYRIYENHDAVRVKTYYMKFDPNIDDYKLDDNVLYIKGQESFVPGIITKTLKGFKYFEDDLNNYDYIVRTNLSTVIDFRLLANELEQNPIKYYGGGHKRTLQWTGGGIDDETWFGTDYIEGTAIILTPKAVKHMLDNEHLVRKEIIDDVSIAIFMREHAPQEIVQDIDPSKYVYVPCFFEEGKIHILAMITMVVKNKFIFYRNKCSNQRQMDSIQMNVIADIITRNEKDMQKSQ